MSKYPFIKQEGIKDCGVTCLAMIIKYYDGFISLEKLRVLTKTSKFGVNAYNLCEGAKEIGFESYGIHTTLKDFDLGKIVLPCIAHIKINNYQHYVVIYKINHKKKFLIIADPASKVKKVTFDEFNSIWEGVIINLYPIRKIPLENSNSLLKTFFEIIKPYSKLILNIFFYSILTIIFSCISSIYFKTLIDNLNTSKQFLMLIFIVFLIIHILKFLNSFFRNKLIIYFNQKIDMRLSVDIYNKIIELPYQYYRNRTTGEIVSRFNDLNLVKDMINKALFNIFIDLPLLIVSFILICLIDIKLSLILLGLCLIYGLIVFCFQPFINNYIDKIQEKKASTTSTIVESISGFETVKNLNITTYFKNLFKEKYFNLLNKKFSLENLLNVKQLFNETIFDISTIVILFLGSLKIFDGNLTIGSLIMFYSLMNYFIESNKNLFNLDVSYKNSKNALRRIVDILVFDKDNGIVGNINKGIINYHNLFYSYNDKTLALNNINLTIKCGEKVLITGSSGSGKSTLLKLLMRYYKVNNNQIFIDDIDLNYYKESALKQDIIYISQNEILFSDSIINNLCLGEEKNLSEVVRSCEIDTVLNKRNLNFNYIIEENGFNFSGGEKQRIILGRALLKKFKILLIDEGLNQMDSNLERRILKRLFKKYRNETIIVVSHRMNNADLYDRNIELCKGEIVKDVRKSK